ncbi:hypothetical protein LTR53_006918 [Teratosphaeriaceae sp. CCFEE 6253]|nr:hypothetical protein LTR53_006918 [Teratosphaeriaceae sp. CCFEE 6253]
MALSSITLATFLGATCVCAASSSWSNGTSTSYRSPSLSAIKSTASTSTSTSTSTSSSTSTYGAGDYVASGIGLTSSTPSTRSSSSTGSSLQPTTLSTDVRSTSEAYSSSTLIGSTWTGSASNSDVSTVGNSSGTNSVSSTGPSSSLIASSNSSTTSFLTDSSAIPPNATADGRPSSSTSDYGSLTSLGSHHAPSSSVDSSVPTRSIAVNGSVAVGTGSATYAPSHFLASANSSERANNTQALGAAVTKAPAGYPSSGFHFRPANGTSLYGITAVTGTGYTRSWQSSNATNETNADACWTSWTDYWYTASVDDAAMVSPGETVVSTSYDLVNVTLTMDFTVTSTIVNSSSGTFTRTTIATEVAANGPWVQTTKTTTNTITETGLTWWDASTTTLTETDEFPWFDLTPVGFSTTTMPLNPRPRCRLPSSYSGCQQAWEQFATSGAIFSQSNGYELSCTQANVTGAACESMIESVAKDASSHFWTDWRDWPTSSVLAPGCNLGCGKCAVTGGTVELLYFPPGLTPNTDGPVIATLLGTTLTSPTAYISLAAIHAMDGCGAVGPTKGATIIPIEPGQLSSSYEVVHSTKMGEGDWDWACQLLSGTAAFNVSDLTSSPIPYEIYQSQPYCADIVMFPDVCTAPCPMTQDYAPILVVPTSLLNSLDPAWETCFLDIRGLYDPPNALTPVTLADTPARPKTTAADASHTVAATPASGPASQTMATNTSPALSTASGGQGADTQPPRTSSIGDPTKAATSAGSDSAQTAPVDPTSPSYPTSPPNNGAGSAPTDPPAQSQILNPGAGGTSAPNDPASPDPASTSISGGSSATQDTPGSSPQATPGAGGNGSPQVPADGNSAPASVADPASQILSALQPPATQGASPVNSAGEILSSALNTFASQAGAGGGADGNGGGTDGASSPQTALNPSRPEPGSSGGPPGDVVVNDQTIHPGATTSVGDQPISIGTGLIVIGSSTIVAPATPSTAVVGGQTFTLGPAVGSAPTGVAVNGATLLPGISTTLNGQDVSVGSSFVVIAGSTIANPPGPSVATVAGEAFTLEPGAAGQAPDPPSPSAAGLVIDGQILQPGGTAVLNGESVSVGNGYAVIAGSTVFASAGTITAVLGGKDFVIGPVETPSSDPSGNTASGRIYDESSGGETAISIDPAFTITAAPGDAIVIAGQTVAAGGPAITVSGHTFAQSGTQLIVDGTRTVDLPTGSGGSPSTISVDTSLSITATPGLPLLIDGHTLVPGGAAITVSDHVFSEQGTRLVIDGTRTIDLPLVSAGVATTISVDPSLSITATPGLPLNIDGHALVPGGAALTLSGHVFRELGTQLIIDGTRTINLPTLTSDAGAFITTVLVVGKRYTISDDPAGRTVVVDAVTLSVGGPARLVGGKMVSAILGGVLIGESVITNPAIGSEVVTTATVRGDVFTIVEDPSGRDAFVDGVEVSVGGPAMVIDGQTVSAIPGGVNIAGTTLTLVPAHPTPGGLALSTLGPEITGALPAGDAAGAGAATTTSFGIRDRCTPGWALIMAGLLLVLLTG